MLVRSDTCGLLQRPMTSLIVGVVVVMTGHAFAEMQYF